MACATVGDGAHSSACNNKQRQEWLVEALTTQGENNEEGKRGCIKRIVFRLLKQSNKGNAILSLENQNWN